MLSCLLLQLEGLNFEPGTAALLPSVGQTGGLPPRSTGHSSLSTDRSTVAETSFGQRRSLLETYLGYAGRECGVPQGMYPADTPVCSVHVHTTRYIPGQAGTLTHLF